MLVTGIILALYFWAYFADVSSIGAALLVSDEAAIGAGVAFVASFVSYLWAPKKYIFAGTYMAFIVLCISAALLVLNTGGASSPFIALWMIVSVFAGVFGAYGLLPLFFAVLAYMVLGFSGGTLSRESLVTVVLVGELPLLASFIIWHTKNKAETSSDKAYKELASEFSQVAGKSDAIINAIGDGVVALNSQGVIQLVNPAAQQIVGWGKQDAVSLDYKSVLKLLDKNDKELTPANDPISQVLATNKEVATNDLTLLTHSGKKLLVSVIVSPVGQIGSGVIVVFRDITKEKAEEREQAEFISTAAHEMRTPVASIEGYLGLALNPTTAQVDEKAREYIGKAQQSAQHLGRLFQDLLDVSRAEDGRLSNTPKVVDVVTFTHDIVQGLESKAQAKGLRLLFKPEPEDEDEKAGERRLNPVFYANVDNDHLREVLNNLVENAIKYTPKGEVVIDIGGDGEHVIISVTDSGIGIPKEDQVHLFQKFYRVDNTATREIGGTGLGLYLSRRLVEAMNGRIWLESEFQRGSTFYVELPRLDHEEATRMIEAASMNAEVSPAMATIESVHASPILRVESPATPPAAVSELEAQPAVPPVTPTQAPSALPPVSSMPQPVAQTPALPQTPPTPIPTVMPAPQPPAQAPPARPNTPLSSIEQNPNQYTRYRPSSVPVPPRNQKQP